MFVLGWNFAVFFVVFFFFFCFCFLFFWIIKMFTIYIDLLKWLFSEKRMNWALWNSSPFSNALISLQMNRVDNDFKPVNYPCSPIRDYQLYSYSLFLTTTLWVFKFTYPWPNPANISEYSYYNIMFKFYLNLVIMNVSLWSSVNTNLFYCFVISMKLRNFSPVCAHAFLLIFFDLCLESIFSFIHSIALILR